MSPGGSGPPQDRTIIVPELRVVSSGLFIALCFLASTGILIAASLIVFNFKFSTHRYTLGMISQSVLQYTLLSTLQ